ncbi:MAG: thiamine pyrophosphate-dependent enzyme, partial [Halolamina sp.]
MTSPSETGETAPTDHGGSDTVQYLAPDGTPLPDADLPALSDETLVRMYEDLVFARRFDERATSLQRQGRISTWAPMAGQEASQIASTVAMAEEDYLYPTYRDNAAKFVHGTDPAAVLARLAGHVDASDDAAVAFGAAERVFPESIPIASHLPHAVGGAMATTYQDGDAVHVAHFGDGATSEGDFHEALNFA